MKNLIINNVNDLKNTLKQKNKAANNSNATYSDLAEVAEEEDHSVDDGGDYDNMSDNENVYADDYHHQEFSYVITTTTGNVVCDRKDDDLLDEEDTYIVESFEQTYNLADDAAACKKENVKIFKSNTSTADSIEKSLQLGYNLSGVPLANSSASHQDVDSMRSLSSMSGISSQGLGGSTSSNTSSSSSLSNNNSTTSTNTGLVISRLGVSVGGEADSGMMSSASRSQASSSVSPPSQSSLSSDIYYSATSLSYHRDNGATFGQMQASKGMLFAFFISLYLSVHVFGLVVCLLAFFVFRFLVFIICFFLFRLTRKLTIVSTNIFRLTPK